MSTSGRIGLTALFVVGFIAVAFFRMHDPAIIVIAAIVTIILIVVIWVVKHLQPEYGGTNKRPANLDRAAKQLVAVIKKNFKDDAVGEIADSAQEIIVTTVRALNTGKIKSIDKAVDDLQTVAPTKFAQEKNTVQLAATLASYYLQAEAKGDDGYTTKTRIDNFIAGIDDMSL
jgi:hypothetical protein